jgi:gliding motility associated protien GldN
MLVVAVALFAINALQAQNKSEKSAEEKEIKTESSAPAEDMYVDDIVAKRLVVENRVLPYEPIREADIAWQKRIWRLIDAREKMNNVWKAEEAPFINIIKALVQNGDITVFKDEQFKEPLNAEEVEGKFFKIDTSSFFNEETYIQEVKVFKNTIDWRSINQFRVKEIWYFDEEASMLKCRILGIAPMFEEQITGNDDGSGMQASVSLPYPLFYIYYPEARTHLAKHRVISDNNDMAPMSWADLLDNRYFASYIYKKSNVLDYALRDYNPNSETLQMDILLESEKIKNELFNFEHDLWEY